MEITDKKESDINNTQTVADSVDNNNKDAEERQARELKANLHPLKVLIISAILLNAFYGFHLIGFFFWF